MAAEHRPLSPHVQVYRPQLTSVLSIIHRMTGLLLAAATPVFVAWLVAIAAGPWWYGTMLGAFSGLSGRMSLLLAAFAFCYHLCNGVRHLFWDAGLGFELRQIYASGWTVVIASLVLTVGVWLLALTGAGGTGS